MALQFESISTVFVGAATTAVVPKPAGLTIGDLMVAAGVTPTGAAIVIGVPAGWTKHDQSQPAITSPKSFLASKIADAADVAASTFTFTSGTAASWVAGIWRISGASGLDVFSVADVSNVALGNPTLPALLTTAIPTLILRFTGTDTTGDEPSSLSDPAGHTRRALVGGAAQGGSSDVVGVFWTKDALVSPTATVPSELITLTGNTGNTRSVQYTIAISQDTGAVTLEGFTKAFTNFSDSKPQSLTIPVPPGTVLNELLVAVISEAVDRPARTIPAGWALVDRSIGFQPMDLDGRSTSQGQALLSVFFRIASASEPASYSWSWSNAFGTGRFGYMLRFSGQDLTRPFDDAQAEGGTVASPGALTGFVYRSNAPTAPGSFVIRFGMGFTVSTAAGGPITGPAGDVLLDSDVSSQSSNGIQVWIGIGSETPLTGTGPFPKSFLVPTASAKYTIGTLTIAAARTPSIIIPRVETATRRVSHVQNSLSPRFSDFTDDMVIPPTDLGDLLLSIGFFNPALGNPQSVTIPAGWTSVRITDLTRSRGVASVDRRIVGGSEPLFYTWTHGASSLRRFQNITLAIKGFNPSNPINAEGINEDLIGGVAGSPFDSPSVVTTVDGCLILRYIVSDQGLSFEFTKPAGSTEIIAQESVIIGTRWKTQVVSEGIQAVAGATGVASWGVLVSALGKAAGTIAIEPGMVLPPGGGPIGGGPFRILARHWRYLGTGA